MSPLFSSTPRARRVYTSVLLSATLLLVAFFVSRPARAQLDLTVEPAMTKGRADAPVVIVEFSDYQ